MKRIGLLLAFITPFALNAQLFSVGVKAGVPFTDAFSDQTFRSGNFSPTETVHSYTSSKEYLIGPMVEIHLPFGFSVEADALYRPLNFVSQTATPYASVTKQNTNFSSWEFPILAKYHFAFPVVKPYIEAGPSFRSVGGQFGSDISNSGFTAGAGVEVKLGRLRIGPELRYTHWGSDSSSAPSLGFASNQNQGEFLVGFSF